MRLLFTKLSILLLLRVFISCNEIPGECQGIIYDGALTTLNGHPFSGSCATYYKSSKKLYSIQQYKNGIDHGKWLFYFDNGSLMTEGQFDNGKKVGLWKYFYKNGSINKEHYYDSSGKPSGIWKTYDETGELLSINQM